MITIRPFKNSDAPALIEIFNRAVNELASGAYGPHQIAIWTNLCLTPDQWIAAMTDGRTTFIAVDENDQPVAFTDVESDGHIRFLYASPDIAGTGVVTKLYESLEAEAIKQGIGKLYSEASELAKSFMLKQGFSVVERRDFELCGVPIHNYAVEKRLRTPR